jgi:outer membrane lipoprotein-sorting protein
MKKRQILYLLLLLLPLLQAAAQQPDATGIMDKTRELTLTGSLSATVSLTITEKNGTVRNRTISMLTKSYTGGTEKRLIKFTEPADVKGTSMLITDNKDKADEMWIYLPALKKTRRIVSTEKGKSFMSSEFSNADFSSPALADFSNRHLQGSGSNGQWIIESKPLTPEKADEYGFSRKVSYIGSENSQVRKIEFYNFDNELFKIVEIKAVQPGENGRYIVKDMTAKNLLNGRGSEIKFSNIAMNSKIDDSSFTLQNLEK